MSQQGNHRKIIIAGGGTGGHIFPAIAIAQALEQAMPSVELLFVGAQGKMEMEKVPEAGYKIIGLDIAGFNRSNLLKNIGLPFKLIKSFLAVKKVFKTFQPDACVGVGGYSTFPVLRYAQSKSIPTFIHESNSFAGKSNILLGKKATKIFVAGAGMEKFFPSNKIIVTGNPVRKNIVEAKVDKSAALAFFNLVAQKKTVLIIGGSLGAKSINDAILNSIDRFESSEIQLIWQTGKQGADQYKTVVQHNKNIWVNSFITQMEKAYAAADIVISRAGAMSVTEITVTAKPTVFVPYPFAAEDHQTANANYLVQQKAALMVKDNEAKDKLAETVINLANDTGKQTGFIEQLKKLAITDADTRIVKEILSEISYTKR